APLMCATGLMVLSPKMALMRRVPPCLSPWARATCGTASVCARGVVRPAPMVVRRRKSRRVQVMVVLPISASLARLDDHARVHAGRIAEISQLHALVRHRVVLAPGPVHEPRHPRPRQVR